MFTEKEIFLELLKPAKEKVWHFILTFIKEQDEAKDILSETIIAAYENFGKLKDKEAFLSWLFTIARRKFYKRYKQISEIIGSSQIELDDLAGDGFSPEKLANLNDLYQALDKLQTEQKEAVVLTSIYGFSYAETAKIQGASENTVKVRVYRAKNKLKQLLEIEK